MASMFAYETSSEALLHPARHAQAHAAFFKDWDRAVDNQSHGHGLLCAEMSRLAYASEDVVGSALTGIGFTLLEFISGKDLKDTQGFIARSVDGKLTVLAFRGTESDKLEDLFVDGDATQTKWPGSEGCLVHKGFSKCWAGVKARVTQRLADRSGKLLVTGHSLGAAIATIAAIDLQPDALILFGSPLVGNEKLGSLLTGTKDIRRYVNCCDLIARIPPGRLDQQHLSQLFAELVTLKIGGSFGAFLGKRAIQAAAGAVAAAAHLAHLDPHYAHVAPARYIDQNGTIQPGITDENRHKDQEAARRAYRLSPTSPPFRDLADHTPLNYVSAFAGRTRSST